MPRHPFSENINFRDEVGRGLGEDAQVRLSVIWITGENVLVFASIKVTDIIKYSKWFEPRSISSSCSVIVRVSVVLKRTVGDSD